MQQDNSTCTDVDIATAVSLPKLLDSGNLTESNAYTDLLELYKWISKQTVLENPGRIASILVSDEDCLTSADERTRLILSCCLAHVLRITVPSHPFQHAENLEMVLLLILGQLARALQSPFPNDQKEATNLLQCLTSVKVFRLCSLISRGKYLVANLLSVMLNIAEQKSGDERSLILKLLKGVLDDPVCCSNPESLVPLVEGVLTGGNNCIARALIHRAADKPLEISISRMLIWIFQIMDSNPEKRLLLPDSLKGLAIYRLVRELYGINRKLVEPAYPLFESRLRSLDEVERLECFGLITHILSLEGKNDFLWPYFFDRLTDMSARIRLQWVHSSMQLYQMHPPMQSELREAITQRCEDTDHSVRCEVAAVLSLLMLRDVSSACKLLPILVNLAEDREVQVQTEALRGMSRVYKHHFFNVKHLTHEHKEARKVIIDRIMHNFFKTSLISKYLTERLLHLFIVPSTLPLGTRMEFLLYILSEADDLSIRAFQAMQNFQRYRRDIMHKWLSLSGLERRQMNQNCTMDLHSCIPDSDDRYWGFHVIDEMLVLRPGLLDSFLKLVGEEPSDTEIQLLTEQIMQGVAACSDETPANMNKMHQILMSFNNGLVTKDGLKIIVQLVQNCIEDPWFAENLGFNRFTVKERIANAVKAFSDAHSDFLLSPPIIKPFLDILTGSDINLVGPVLGIISAMGGCLEEKHPDLARTLSTSCQTILFESGTNLLTPKLAEQIVRFFKVDLPESKNDLLTQILQYTKTKLDEPLGIQQLPYIALLGYISDGIPKEQQPLLKSVISRKVVKELLMKAYASEDTREIDYEKWCEEEDLPPMTYMKVHGIRTMGLWVVGAQSEDVTTIGNTLRMMNAFVTTKGDLLDERILSPAEKRWLRLEAGLCMIKICKMKRAMDQVNTSQVHSFAHLVMDDEVNVRRKIVTAIRQALTCAATNKLPEVFLGILALSNFDPDLSLKEIANSMVKEYLSCGGRSQWPERCLYWVLPLVAMAPLSWILPSEAQGSQGSWDSGDQIVLQHLRQILWWFVFDPLITEGARLSYGRLKAVVQRIKNHEDALPTDWSSNLRLWVTCDLALGLLASHSSNLSQYQKRSINIDPLLQNEPLHLLKPPENPSYHNPVVYVEDLVKTGPQTIESMKTPQANVSFEEIIVDGTDNTGRNWEPTTYTEVGVASTSFSSPPDANNKVYLFELDDGK